MGRLGTGSGEGVTGVGIDSTVWVSTVDVSAGSTGVAVSEVEVSVSTVTEDVSCVAV